MTSGQRKAHKISWIVLAIIIPVFMFFVIKDLNFNSLEKSTVIAEGSNKEILKSSENEFLKANLYEDRLEIILKSPLKNASSVVYTIDSNGKHQDAVGQVTNSGIYSFSISDLPKGIALYDNIKETEITKLFF